MDLLNLKAASTITIELDHPATGEKLEGFSVACYAPSSIKYKSAVMKVAKKYAEKDGKQFLEMDDAEIEQAINKSVATIVDTVIAVTTDCELVFDGEKLTLEQFKALIAKEEYFWIVQQVKDELDSGKFAIQG